jgi:hypothetical protein
VKAKNVNIIATGDSIFPAFTMAQKIMPELSRVATDKNEFAVITETVFRLTKNNANNSSWTSENHIIQR